MRHLGAIKFLNFLIIEEKFRDKLEVVWDDVDLAVLSDDLGALQDLMEIFRRITKYHLKNQTNEIKPQTNTNE